MRAFDRGAGAVTTPFLTVPDVRSEGERGLLGLAFDPGYATNRLLYVNYTGPAGNPRIDRVDMSGAAPSFTPVMRIAQNRSNHNGGFMGFSPADNQLYITTGDSGGGENYGWRLREGSEPTPGVGGDIYQLKAVPLPAALWMFVGALAVLGARRRAR